MTTVAVIQCQHLESGERKVYAEYHGRRICLVCAHDLYVRHEDPRLAGIYMHVEGARKDRAELENNTEKADKLARLRADNARYFARRGLK